MLRELWLDGLASDSKVKVVRFQMMLAQSWARWQMASRETWDNGQDKRRGWLEKQVSGLEMQVPHAWENPYQQGILCY